MYESFVSIALTACGDEHSHAYKAEWANDKTYLWHACEGEDCSEVSDKAEHAWNEGVITTEATVNANREKTYTCTVCSATKKEAVEFTGVSKEKWNSIVNPAILKNITLKVDAAFISGYSGSSPSSTTIKVNGDSVATTSNEKTQTTDTKTAESQRNYFTESIFSMLNNFDKFKYDKTNKCYKATENITYTANILIFETKLTAENVTIELDSNINISKITCRMTQEFETNGTPTTYALDAIFTFSNYGTTVVN